MSGDSIIKLVKTKDKDKLLKAVRKIYFTSKVWEGLVIDFSSEMVKLFFKW